MFTNAERRCIVDAFPGSVERAELSAVDPQVLALEVGVGNLLAAATPWLSEHTQALLRDLNPGRRALLTVFGDGSVAAAAFSTVTIPVENVRMLMGPHSYGDRLPGESYEVVPNDQVYAYMRDERFAPIDVCVPLGVPTRAQMELEDACTEVVRVGLAAAVLAGDGDE